MPERRKRASIRTGDSSPASLKRAHAQSGVATQVPPRRSCQAVRHAVVLRIDALDERHRILELLGIAVQAVDMEIIGREPEVSVRILTHGDETVVRQGEKSPGVVLKFLKVYPSKRLTPYHVQTHTKPRESV